jgi:hypothetical protein
LSRSVLVLIPLRGLMSGSSPIRIADCRVGERICILIRPASRWQSGVAPSGVRCG